MTRRILSTINRLGKQVDILTMSETGTDEFNNPEHTWTKTGETQCVRTYPNRNSQFENRQGRYNEDRPVFIFAHGNNPDSGSRIVYDGITYELKSPTTYDTHTTIFGEVVS